MLVLGAGLGWDVCIENPGINSWLRRKAYRVEAPEGPARSSERCQEKAPERQDFLILYFYLKMSSSEW
jgi:hypothetical protein